MRIFYCVPFLSKLAYAMAPILSCPHGVAAWCCMQRLAHGWAADGDHKAGAEFARHAIELGGDDPTALSTAALALGMLSRDLDRAAAALDRSLMLNPNSAQALMFSSFVHSMLGDAQTGIDHAQRAMRLSPLDPIGYRTKSAMGLACLIAGRVEEANDWQDKALHEHSHYVPALIHKIAGCAAAGRIDDARAAGCLAGVYSGTPACRSPLTNSSRSCGRRSGMMDIRPAIVSSGTSCCSPHLWRRSRYPRRRRRR
jgi:tetratricopeptide (TPR) repeat protein